MLGHCHINFGVLSKRNGESAAGRMGYQASARFTGSSAHPDSEGHHSEYRGTIILLPRGGNPQFADEANLVFAATLRDTRANAQCGRTIEFSLPRAIPAELLLLVAAFVMAPFVAMGMVIRLDCECPLASDGGPHPHAHGWIAQRVLEDDGFGLKERSWNVFFRRAQGCHVRALIAGRLTLACALLGIEAYVDPRRNDARGLGDPEPRVPDDLWKMRDRGETVSQIEEIIAARGKRDPQSEPAVQPQPVKDSPEAEVLVIQNVISAKKVTKVDARKSAEAISSELVKMGGKVDEGKVAEIQTQENSNSSCRGSFDGSKFKFTGPIDERVAGRIIQLMRAVGWPALVVEGNQKSADLIISAGIPFNLTAVNRAAGTETLKFIKEKYGAQLLDQIRPYDPLQVAEAILAKSRTANTKTKGIVVAEKIGENEYHDSDDFDLLDMPQPSASAVEEETRRRNAEFAQRYFSKQQRELDEIVQMINRRTKPASPQSSPSNPISK